MNSTLFLTEFSEQTLSFDTTEWVGVYLIYWVFNLKVDRNTRSSTVNRIMKA